MTQPIATLPTPPHRSADTASRVVQTDSSEQSQFQASDEGLSFDEVLNSLNPLHHVPIVSTIYQAVSGEKIGIGPRMIAATILGGPVGLIIAGIAAFIEEMSGGTIAEHAVALFEGTTGDGEPAPGDAIAAVSNHIEGDVGGIDASALADSPIIQPEISETRMAADWAADWNGEAAAAVAPAMLGAMSPLVSRPDVESVKSIGLKDAVSDAKRNSLSLLQAQRAQANLLLANLSATDAAKSRSSVERDGRDGEEREPHSNLPPAGANPLWYADAMQRALDKYRAGPATPTGAP